jgi:cytoskeletal protein RodZ
MNPRHLNRSTSRVILSGFALVGVLLATVSVLGQVNAFSAITDAIGVTSPPGTSQSSSGSSTSSPSADETSNEETSDSVVDAPATGDTPDGEVAPIDPEIDARISALEDLVVTLAENDDATAATLSEVTGLVKTLDADLATAKTSLGNLAERVGANEKATSALRSDVDAAKAVIDALQVSVDNLKLRTSQLDETGTYSGVVKPSQISPQLKVDDIKGDWPIARTSGPLDGARIKMPFGQCANAYQQYTVVVVPGVFEGIQCLRILTPR